MAFNVYLVFFFNVDPASFRKYLWAYCFVCFGGPMIPAVVLIALRRDPRGPVYGDAAVPPPPPSLSRHPFRGLTHQNSSGAGLARIGASSAFTRTTSPFGSASSCPLSSTLPWATRSSTIATSCSAFRSTIGSMKRAGENLGGLAAAAATLLKRHAPIALFDSSQVREC